MTIQDKHIRGGTDKAPPRNSCVGTLSIPCMRKHLCRLGASVQAGTIRNPTSSFQSFYTVWSLQLDAVVKALQKVKRCARFQGSPTVKEFLLMYADTVSIDLKAWSILKISVFQISGKGPISLVMPKIWEHLWQLGNHGTSDLQIFH